MTTTPQPAPAAASDADAQRLHAPTPDTPAPTPPPAQTPPATPAYPLPGYGAPPPVVVYYSYGPPPGQLPPGYPPAGVPGSSFGVREWLTGGAEAVGDTVQKLTDALRSFAEQLTTTLQETLKDAADLHVETYVAEDLAAVNFRAGDFSNAELRAFTRMELDGDTQVLVPRTDMGVDQELWAIHRAMVAEAQANRAAMIKAIAEAASGLFAVVQGK